MMIVLWVILWLAIGTGGFFASIGAIYLAMSFIYNLTPEGRKNLDPLDDLVDLCDRRGWCRRRSNDSQEAEVT